MKHIFAILALSALALSASADNWMYRLPDDAYVSTLSIPGSHDSGTGNGFPGVTTSVYGPFGDKYARTQDRNFEEQWNLGIRAFDLRPAVADGYINVNHGIMPTKLRFDNAIYFLRDKLIENPSEFVVIHLLHASAGDDNASNYGERLLELLGRDDLKDFFVEFKSTLTVREMRGKILLLSRDEYAEKPVGGFFRNWTGQIDWNAQTGGQIVGASGDVAKLYMQDFAESYREGDLDRKVDAVRQMLDFSTKHVTNSASNIVWVYNFASAYSKVSRLYIPLIIDQEISTSDGYRDNAAHTNAAIIDYLNDESHTAGPTGIVLLDYVGVESSNGYYTRGQEVVDVIIANNFRYLQDMYQVEENAGTYRKPIDMSARIVNPCFNSNMLQGWEGDDFGAVNPNENAEHYNKNFDTYQTIIDLPNGVYAVGVKAFYRAGEAEEANAHYRLRDTALRNARLYATTGTKTLTFPIVSPFSKSVVRARGVGREIAVKNGTTTYYTPDDMISAEYYMHSLNAYDNVIFAGVYNHKLKFGVRKENAAGVDWCVFDDFTLKYYGNTADSYRQWLVEMRKRKLSYTGVTVSKCYKEAYNTAYSATASTRSQANNAMQAIDVASENIAINAELWAEYKQVGAMAEEMLSGSQYSDEAKDFLRFYYQRGYLKDLSELELTNEQLTQAISELRSNIVQVHTGGWTGISECTTDNGQGMMYNSYWTLDGKQVSAPSRHGLYLMKASDGSFRKVLR
ncbi:MAG: hypothetical protein IKP36_00565 [Bacteroidaceae bacterium]|nr:hypothetical protein [Bacteroidaceae bacterium]